MAESVVPGTLSSGECGTHTSLAPVYGIRPRGAGTPDVPRPRKEHDPAGHLSARACRVPGVEGLREVSSSLFERLLPLPTSRADVVIATFSPQGESFRVDEARDCASYLQPLVVSHPIERRSPRSRRCWEGIGRSREALVETIGLPRRDQRPGRSRLLLVTVARTHLPSLRQTPYALFSDLARSPGYLLPLPSNLCMCP